MPDTLSAELRGALASEPIDLARAALIVAKIEYPRLDPGPTIARLDEIGDRAARRLDALPDAPIDRRVAELNRLLYDEEGFAANRLHYGDFRNSLLNVVVERRIGIPISLALVYMEVARRAGVEVFGVSFPGHFLLRVPAAAGEETGAMILDPFNGGRRLNLVDCRELLRQQAGEAIRFDRSLLEACTRRQILARMLNNLKRIYVELRSFPHARAVTELLLTVEPAVGAGVHGLPSRRVDRKHASRREARVPRGSRDASDAAGAKPLSFLFELRDRGLIAYHLDDYPAALRDLEHYLRLRTWHDADREEHSRVLEHVRTLRGRVAGLN